MLLDTIFHSLQGKTIIWIPHHLVGVEQMNRVVFIENGGETYKTNRVINYT